MYTSNITCPVCKKLQDIKSFERYTIPVKRKMGFTEPEFEVLVCSNCGAVFVHK